MKNTFLFLLGILGVLLFVGSAIWGGILIDGYDPLSQLISESYAIDTEYGESLRYYGYIPSGILLAMFCFLGRSVFPRSQATTLGFIGIGVFYGLATVVVSIYPCDSGCLFTKEPSLSQFIHNLVGFLTYATVPLCIFMVGRGLRPFETHKRLANQSIQLGLLSVVLVLLFFGLADSEYAGLSQRAVELSFVGWVILCAFAILRLKKS